MAICDDSCPSSAAASAENAFALRLATLMTPSWLRAVTSGTQQIDLMPSAISVGAPAGPKAARSASSNIETDTALIGDSVGRVVERQQMVGRAHTPLVGEGQRMELHLPGFRVVQGDARVVVLNHVAQRLRDLAEDARVIELRRDRVVERRRNWTRSRSAASEAPSVSSRSSCTVCSTASATMRRDLLHHGHGRIVVAGGISAAEDDYAQPGAGRRQRNPADDPETEIPEGRHHTGQHLAGVEADDRRLLRSQNDSGRTEVHRDFSHRQWQVRMDERDPQEVAVCIVKDQTQMVERHRIAE